MKKGLAAVWIVLITVVVMAGLAAGGWYYMDSQQKAQKKDWDNQVSQLQEQVDKLKDQVEQAAASADESGSDSSSSTTNSAGTVDQYLYNNTTYDFSLQFNSLWAGYQMKEASNAGSAKTYYVCVPTTDSDWQAATTTSLAGTVSLFALSIYSQSQWSAATSEEGPVPSLVGQSGNWYIGYSPAQAYPEDKAPLASDVPNILATFTAI